MQSKRLRYCCVLLSVGVTMPALPCTAFAEASAEAGWQHTRSGYTYLLPDGSLAVGEMCIDGTCYLFAPNGVLQVGWQTVNGLRYYYTPNAHAPYFGWLQWRDGEYYITEETGKSVGFTETDRGLCCFDAYGVLQYGWLYDAQNQRYYADADGSILTGAQSIGGLPYLFDAAGVQQLGWQEIDGKRYYYDESGKGRYQWQTLDGGTYYLTAADGALTGEQTIDGTPHVFGADGALLLGWYTYADGTTIYVDANGDTVSGLQSIDGALYYFSDDYRMQTGFRSIADAVYYFNQEGKAQTGFFTAEGNRYYADADGILQNGWLTIADERYYCDENGMLLTGWQTVDDMICYFTPMGVLSVGWQIIEGSTYYFSDNGKLSTGWLTLDDATYYFDAQGKMQCGIVTVDDVAYAFDAQGRLVRAAWYRTGETAYYCNADGTLCCGWQLIEGKYYHFGENGAMTVSATVDGYIIDANGVASTPMRAQVAALLAESGTSPAEIYKYTTSHYRYLRIEDTRTYAELEAAGWDTLVEYTLANRKGVCYYLAATTDYFLQLAGHKTRLVYAYSGTGDHYWCQVWNGTEWRNYDPTYSSRANLTLEQLFAIKEYTINGYATITYNERGDYMGIAFEAAN